MMGWFPIGPDFVFAPRDGAFQRLTRWNEAGRQGLVSCIAIEPGDPNTIYVVVRPSTGGASLFRTRDGGASWDPIGDWLRSTQPNLDPTWVAIHPVSPSTIYLASAGEAGVYISNSRGDAGSWGPRNNVGASPLKLVVDPRNAANLATTVIYATAWQSGLHRSTDGGTSWPRVLTADPTSFVAHMPAAGTAHFYVGSWAQGLWHATDPAGPWTNLCTQAIGLPAFDAAVEEGNYLLVLVDLCTRNPDRVYAWFARGDRSTGLYTTSASATSWTRVVSAALPNPAWGLYAKGFAVAPNSPGNGANDVLFFGNIPVNRSIDAGVTWRTDGVGFHADIHAFAFDPAAPGAGVVPTTYLGCDGGIARSVKAADPTVAIETVPANFNQGSAYDATRAGWINLNHGKGSVAVICYASDPGIPAVSYIGCQDSGVASGEKTLGWRGLADADVYTGAAARGPAGVSFWLNYGLYGNWPGFRISRFNDRRTSASLSWVAFGASLVANTSNFSIGRDGKLLTGMVVRDGSRTIAAAVPAGAQTVTPANMTGIRVGSVVVIEPGVANQEESVVVTAVAATTFTATFAIAHPANATMLLERAFVGRADHADVAVQISQDFGDNRRQVSLVVAHPTDANVLYCATNDGSRVWMTNAGAAAGPGTVWSEVANTRPTPGTMPLSWIAVDAAGTAYALWMRPVPDATGAVTTPLYRLAGGAWTAEPTTGAVPPGYLGKLLADPVRANVLYVNSRNTVYRLEKVGANWVFTDIGAGLPGAPVYDLWVANIGTPAAPKVLLRAAVTTRGIFEADVTAGATDPAVALYLRDHFLDQALLPLTAEGLSDPYNPTDPAATLWHYMCADVKVDVRAAGGFLQTDPEGSAPLANIHFDMLRDNSQNLASAGTGVVRVQVHNRSRTPLGGVKVWAIFCRASGGVPALSRSASMGNNFPFWSQFTAGGNIVPNLPTDSPWTSVGAPQTLLPIDADHPRVASFPWTIPTLTPGDTGHYCIAVFVHAPTSLIGETTDMSVDSITPRNRQVGQKNVHVVAGPGPGPAPGGGGAGGGGRGGGAPLRIEEYVEFHNPTNRPRVAALHFDLRGLPESVRPSLRLTPMKTRERADRSMEGIVRTRRLLPGQDLTARVWREAVDSFRALRFVLGGPSDGRLRALEQLARARFRRWTKCVLGDRQQKPAHRLPRFEPVVYEIKPSAQAVVTAVEIPPFERVGALLTLKAAAMPAGKRHFQVQQLVDEQVVGGSVYILGMDEDEKRPPEVVDEHRTDEGRIDPGELRRLEKKAEEQRYVPPWIREAKERRKRELGKEIDAKRRSPFGDVESEEERNDREDRPERDQPE